MTGTLTVLRLDFDLRLLEEEDVLRVDEDDELDMDDDDKSSGNTLVMCDLDDCCLFGADDDGEVELRAAATLANTACNSSPWSSSTVFMNVETVKSRLLPRGLFVSSTGVEGGIDNAVAFSLAVDATAGFAAASGIARGEDATCDAGWNVISGEVVRASEKE